MAVKWMGMIQDDQTVPDRVAQSASALHIGHYPAGMVAPELHLLDLILTISADHVLVSTDEMSQVFDYDPLLSEIAQIAGVQHYTTQEYLLTRIVQACAAYPQIIALEAQLYKSPVLGGSVGIQLVLGADDLDSLRATAE
jgi:dihydroneopterin aldolase